MRGRTREHWWGVVLDAPDPSALARFYARLLDWEIAAEEPTWVTLKPPDGIAYIAFHISPEYVPPVWPPVEGRPQQMLHLDIEVGDLDEAVADAVEMGARLADFQPQKEVRVMLDPIGHPFCLYLGS
jgi:catechol 2,3-dioxygenase-like lactoylglutathione lyase family enzyme